MANKTLAWLRAGLVAMACAGSAAAQVVPDAVSDEVGATPGEFRVDESGSATYRIPIYAAPGTAGVTPQIALSYSSQGGNGPLGKGWAIAGLSAISRCRASREAGDFIVSGVATDGNPGPVDFSANDRFCLDGQRLLPAPSGAPACPAVTGMTAANLRTEVESWSRVCAYTPTGGLNGPAFFTVDRKDGSTSWYGDRSANASANRPDGYFETSAAGHTGKAVSWAQTRFQDSTGNYIDYHYLENPAGSTGIGEHLISEVRYTGKTVLPGQTGSALAPYAKLVFNYTTLPIDQWSIGYQSGAQYSQTQRLASVDSFNNSVAVRHYSLGYGTSVSGSGAAILESVQECRNASLAVCLAPTAFVWSQAVNSFSTWAEIPAVSLGSPDKFEGFKLGDVDGDGRQDMVWMKDGKSGEACSTEIVFVAYGTIDSSGRSTFQMPNQIPACTPAEIGGLGEGGWFLLDYNGDGKDDLMLANATGASWVIRPSYGRPTSAGYVFNGGGNLLAGLSPGIPGTGSKALLPQLSDLNGDGLLDVIVPRNGVMYARLMQRQGATHGWGAERQVVFGGMDTFCSGGGPGSRIGCDVSNALYTKSGNSQLFDFNADSRADILATIVRTREQQTGECQIQRVAPSPSGVRATGKSAGGSRAQVIGGLRCTTFASDTYVYAFTVSSLTDTTITLSPYQAWWTESYSDESGFPITTTRQKGHQFADINGDGLTDAVYEGTGENWYYNVNTGYGFAAAELIGPIANDDYVKVQDVTGDGRADLLYPAPYNGNKVFFQRPGLPGGGFGGGWVVSGGNAIACGGSTCDLWKRAYIFGDFDSDGAADFFGLRIDDTLLMSVSQPAQTSRFRARDVITRIQNGYGAITDISYRPLSLAALYRAETNSRDLLQYGRGSAVHDVLAPSYVVAWVNSSSPVHGNPNAMASVYYRYAGAKAQAGGRGFLGFREITTFDANFSGTPVGHVATTTTYRQDYPFVGMPASTVKRRIESGFAPPACFTLVNEACFGSSRTPFPALGGRVFSDSQQVWASQPAFGAGSQLPLHPVTGSTAEASFDPYTGAALSRVATAFTYDAYGNALTTSVSTSTGAGTLQSTVATSNTYVNDGPRWRLGRLATSTVTHSRPGLASVVRSTSFGYDMAGAYTGQLLVERVQPAGGAQFDLRKMYTLDVFGNRTQVATCSAGITDANCRAAAITMLPVAQADGTPSLSVHRYSRTAYDAIGRFPVTVTEPFRNTSNAAVATVVQQVIARDAFGEPTHTRNALGVDTMAVSGHLGRPYYTWSESVAGATPGAAAQGVESWTTYRWCGTGTNQVSCPSGAAFRQQVQTEGAPVKWTYHDKLGRPMLAVSQSFHAGITGKEFSAVCTFSDVHGRSERVSNPFFLDLAAVAGAPNVPADTCGSRMWNRTVYDILGRPVRAVFADTSEVSTSYSALTTTTTDPLGRTASEVRNAMGEKVQVTDAVGLVTTYSYDAAGNMTLVRRAGERGAVDSTFTYDVLGRKLTQVDPDTGTWRYDYNPAGELRIQTDGKGQKTYSFHDARGRIYSKKVYTAASVLESQYTYNFDTAPNGLGALHSEGATGIEVVSKGYGYDALGRAAAVSTVIDGATYNIANSIYDPLGRLLETQDATGRWLRTEYTPHGFAIRLCEGTGTGGTLCTINGANTYQQTNAVDARGNVVEEKRGALFVKRTFDIYNGRLLRNCSGKTASSADCTAQDETYTWDNKGNLLTRQRGALYTEHFAYDAADRLTKAWFSKIGSLTYATSAPTSTTAANVSEWLSYDKLGNLCERNFGGLVAAYHYAGRAGCGTGGLAGTGTTATTGAHNLVGWWQYGITRDANGNQNGASYNSVKEKGWEYTAQNQARSVWFGASESSAQRRTRWWYGSDGSRYKRVDDGSNNGTLRTVLNLGGVERINQGGAISWRRSLGGGLVHTLAGASPVTTHIRAQLFDHIGSIVAIADSVGNVIETADHAAFGNRREWVNGTLLGKLMLLTTDRGFTGHEQVENLQTIHMNGRIYDPVQARFLQADPLVQDAFNPQNWNPFTYVYNNPLKNTDPTGMFSISKFLGTLATVFQIANYFIPALAPIAAVLSTLAKFAAVVTAIHTGNLLGVAAAFIPGVNSGNAVFDALGNSVIAGGLSEAMGGKFKDGAIGSLKSAALAFTFQVISSHVVSSATGEKFRNGATTEASENAAKSGAVEQRALGKDAYKDNWELGYTASERANRALLAAGVYSRGFDSEQELANSWGDVVEPISEELGTEIGAHFRYDPRSGKYFAAPAWSSGAFGRVNFEGYGGSRIGRLSAVIHTHPSGVGSPTFSIGDYEHSYGLGANAYVISRDYRYQWNYDDYINAVPTFENQAPGYPNGIPYDYVRKELTR